jgi:hypothetical protein
MLAFEVSYYRTVLVWFALRVSRVISSASSCFLTFALLLNSRVVLMPAMVFLRDAISVSIAFFIIISLNLGRDYVSQHRSLEADLVRDYVSQHRSLSLTSYNHYALNGS